MNETRVSTKDTNENIANRKKPFQARNIFTTDIARINNFLDELQAQVKTRCLSENRNYPTAGRSRKGFFPSFKYAVRYMIDGLTAEQAADQYMNELRTGGNIYV